MAKTKHTSKPQDASNSMLLALIAQFLENHGFSSTHRILKTERRKRPEKEGWNAALTSGFPSLETIFHVWEQEHKEGQSASKQQDDGNTSDSSSDTDSEVDKSTTSDDSSDEDVSKSQSSDSSGSELEDASTTPSKKGSKKPTSPPLVPNQIKSLKRKAQDSSSESSESADDADSSSSSDSDDSEDEHTAKKQRIQSASSSSGSESTSEAESESESESDSDSDSNSSSKPVTTLKATSTQNVSAATVADQASSSDSSSSNDSDDDSSESEDSSDEAESGGAIDAAHTQDAVHSDSSGTIVGDKPSAQPVLDTSSSEELVEGVQQMKSKKKHTGTRPTRLAALSAEANMDDFISNTYISYDYADKAFRDLSVTRGKGFTKEKNKKKRGSYRGGPIDISGGKSFKFDD